MTEMAGLFFINSKTLIFALLFLLHDMDRRSIYHSNEVLDLLPSF